MAKGIQTHPLRPYDVLVGRCRDRECRLGARPMRPEWSIHPCFIIFIAGVKEMVGRSGPPWEIAHRNACCSSLALSF
jgi:hypothetical protein